MQSLEYHKANSLQEALELMSAAPGESVFMAGGTDLLVRIKNGRTHPRRLIDLKGIDELDGWKETADEFSIGPLITLRILEADPALIEKVSLLAEAAGKVGGLQVRHKATLGGNLCNASPSADTAPALLALDARLSLSGPSGTRTVDVSEFFTGPGATVLRPDEILTRIAIPLPRTRSGAVYFKLSTRNAMDLAFVGVAVLLELDGKNRIKKARIGLGAVAPTPIRVPEAEALLEDVVLVPEAARRCGEIAAEECRPISDLRASAEYRREMVRELCEQGLMAAYGRAKSSGEAPKR
jgi:CO/xanthine dehydrogenase FAD-binding subunit